jgi:isovaleryl-CoA dehydrogenase
MGGMMAASTPIHQNKRIEDDMLHLPGLTFDHGEDIAALREAVQQFAAAEIAPRAAEIDRSDQFPMDLWRKMGDLGVLGITVARGIRRRPDGLPGPHRGDGRNLARLGVGRPVLRRPLEPVRQPDQAQRHRRAEAQIPAEADLRRTRGMRWRCPSRTPGSDVVSMKLRADKKGDRWVLNGTKMWITNGPDADVLVVYAKNDLEAGPRGMTAFLIEKGISRVSRRRRSSTSWACAARTPANWCSRIAKCRPRTCWAAWARASMC